MPVLAEVNWQGRLRQVVMVGNRNGFFYVLDRVTGDCCSVCLLQQPAGRASLMRMGDLLC